MENSIVIKTLVKPTGFVRISLAFVLLSAAALWLAAQNASAGDKDLPDRELSTRLKQLGFTGNIQATFEQRLGRAVDPARANLGRLLWFDTITGLNHDN